MYRPYIGRIWAIYRPSLISPFAHKVKEEVYEAEETFASQSSESQRSTDSDLSEVDEEAYHTQWRGKHKTQSWRKPDGYRNSSRNYRDQKGYDKSYRKDNYLYNYITIRRTETIKTQTKKALTSIIGKSTTQKHLKTRIRSTILE